MSNDILFKSGAIEITPKVARFGSTSYQIANIGSVAVQSARKMNSWSIWLIIAGVGLGLAAPAIANYNGQRGALIFCAGLAAFIGATIVQKKWPRLEYTLILKTSSGDIQALFSLDLEHVYAVQRALEDAFVRRT